MKPFVTIVLVLCIYLSGSDSAGLMQKSVIFPTKTATSFVKLNAADFSDLTAFTVCLRAASEENHDYTLFSYATKKSHNELLIWQKSNAQLDLYLGSVITGFSLPKMDAWLRHICVSWESQNGEITIWVNGRRSLRKVSSKGGFVKNGGQFFLGQEQDTVGGKFDIKQSFVGEITDVNMWDRALKPYEIKLISQGCYNIGGNLIDWGSTTFTTEGNVKIKDNNDCTH
ncbi:C-reactive protein-like isoform X1 [Amblyraja radiata]|uniref:C-reactive protein-like isoform X1 n=1 Tax=Amblyraja radiata TaxID=386614 RepID=UPI001401D04B|nr:C-reactive protein-like isoform X1 [Amblyraja radiata]